MDNKVTINLSKVHLESSLQELHQHQEQLVSDVELLLQSKLQPFASSHQYQHQVLASLSKHKVSFLKQLFLRLTKHYGLTGKPQHHQD